MALREPTVFILTALARERLHGYGIIGEVKRLSDIFRARIIDVTDTTFCIELTGSGDKLDAYIKALHENNIVEVVRSGSMGILRGEKALTL